MYYTRLGVAIARLCNLWRILLDIRGGGEIYDSRVHNLPGAADPDTGVLSDPEFTISFEFG